MISRIGLKTKLKQVMMIDRLTKGLKVFLQEPGEFGFSVRDVGRSLNQARDHTT